jgi:hypothetical protein
MNAVELVETQFAKYCCPLSPLDWYLQLAQLGSLLTAM